MSFIDDAPILCDAIASAPCGKWAIAVSGGADSVALLRLLAMHRSAPNELVVVHLNHQRRADASDADEQFVIALSRELNLAIETATRDQFESAALPANPSARYRAMRHAFFARVIGMQNLEGVLLAHHADDQAETVMLRLLRGSGWPALAGMSARATVNGLTIARPLLHVRREALRSFLRERHFTFREDASNASFDYERNVVRAALAGHEPLIRQLLELSKRCADLKRWAEASSPRLGKTFSASDVFDLPTLLAGQSFSRWLIDQGISRDRITPELIASLTAMCKDASTPSVLNLPGARQARRKRNQISADGIK